MSGWKLAVLGAGFVLLGALAFGLVAWREQDREIAEPPIEIVKPIRLPIPKRER